MHISRLRIEFKPRRKRGSQFPREDARRWYAPTFSGIIAERNSRRNYEIAFTSGLNSLVRYVVVLIGGHYFGAGPRAKSARTRHLTRHARTSRALYIKPI